MYTHRHTHKQIHKHTDIYGIYTHTHTFTHTGVHTHTQLHTGKCVLIHTYVAHKLTKRQTCNAPSGSLRDTGMDTLDKSFPITQTVITHFITPHYTHQCSYVGLSTGQYLHWPPLDWVMSSDAQLSPTGA